jgi:hypothetical protein
MVEIYLGLREDQIRFLSIPLRDVQRLAFRPFKWLRFVVFCTCGAKGQLSATPNGPPVDYDAGITSLTDDDKYYYDTAGGKFFECKMTCGSTIPISRDIHLRGPLLFRRKDDICCAHHTQDKFQNGDRDTRWAVLRRHSTS